MTDTKTHDAGTAVMRALSPAPSEMDLPCAGWSVATFVTLSEVKGLLARLEVNGHNRWHITAAGGEFVVRWYEPGH